MQAYKFDIRISENGMISLPPTIPNLCGREVELFIVVPQKEKPQKKEQLSATEFATRWAGFLKDVNPEKTKYEYLSEKYK